MADFVPEVDLESDTSSVDGIRDSVSTNEQYSRRVESLQQENRVLKTEIETLKLKIKSLNEANQQLRRNSVNIQAKAEQEEEYISNTLLKKITELKKEKESLAINYEQEEECLTNELNRKFTQLRQEKVALEKTLAREQEDQVCKLKSRIEKLETDMRNKQDCLDRLRREKIELENALEQEQEALVNRLWKKMEKLETEKRTLQEKLESLGAALLSGSSSNQSLTSVSQPGPICDTSGVAAAGAPSASVPLMHGLGSRPCSSSGQGSLRGSLWMTRATHSRNSLGGGVSASPAQMVVVTPSLPSGTCAPTTTVGGGDDEPRQLNQSAAAPSFGCPLGLTLTQQSVGVDDVCDQTTGGQQPPPQSPMDTDAAGLDHVFYSTIGVTDNPPSSRASESIQQKSVEDENLGQHGLRQVGTPPPLQKHRQLEMNGSTVSISYVNRLRNEVSHLRHLLTRYEAESACRMTTFECEERSVAEENRKLRQLLAAEKERREALSRQLSESESSLEMEDERQFNEACRSSRLRTISDSSTPPFHMRTSSSMSQNASAPHTVTPALYGPGHAYAAAIAAGLASTTQATPSTRHACRECGQRLPPLEDHHPYPLSFNSQHMPTHCNQHQPHHRPLSTCISHHHQQQSQQHSPNSTVACLRTGCSCALCSNSPPPSSVNTSGGGPGRPLPLSTSPSTPTTGVSAGIIHSDHDVNCNSCVSPAALSPSFAKPSGRVSGSVTTTPVSAREHHRPMKVEYGAEKRPSSTSGDDAMFLDGFSVGTAHQQGGRISADRYDFSVDSNGDMYDDDEERCATPPLYQPDSTK